MLLDHIRKLQIAYYTVLNPMSLTWSQNEVVIVSHAASANAFLIVGFFIQISVVFYSEISTGNTVMYPDYPRMQSMVGLILRTG